MTIIASFCGQNLSRAFQWPRAAWKFSWLGQRKCAVTSLIVGLAAVTAPAFAQQVIYQPTLFDHSSNTEFNVTIRNGGGSAKGLLVHGGNTGDDADLIKVTNYDGAKVFFNVTDGNVGIGTDEPGASFTVVKPGYTGMPPFNGLAFIHQSSNPDGALLQPALELQNGGGNGYGIVSHAANNYFSGRVGIGSSTPREALDFGGRAKNLRFDYATLGETGSAAGTVLGNNLRASTNTNSRLEVSSNPNDAAHAIYMVYSSGWHFVSLPQGHGQTVGSLVDPAANTKVHITTAGNLGVGISNPQQKLEVNGTIRAKEVIVETSNFPDYVFEEGYNLRSLDEVEDHIRRHGHLPGVPSAEQAAISGVSLGDTQRVLLEKIEELTLYAIEKDRRIEALEKRLSHLEAFISPK